MKIAYLGMGIMGSAMSANIARAGFAVNVWNRTPGKEGERLASAAGATVCADISVAVADADLIFLCLSDVADLEEIIFRSDGVVAYAAKNATLIDMSTTGPACAKRVAALLEPLGLNFMDAPVTGGDIGAKNGTLTIMVGGSQDIFNRCLPVLKTMGKAIHHCGPVGSGQALKLCNQVLCAVNMLAVSEAIGLAFRQQIDPRLLIDVCSSGAAGSWALSNLGPRIVAGDFKPGFMIKDMLKDLRLVQEVLRDESDEFAGIKLAARQFSAVVAKEKNGELQGTQSMYQVYKSNR